MSLTLIGQKREGDATLRINGGRIVYEETWHYILQASSPTLQRQQVITSSLLPNPGLSPSPDTLFAICNSLSASRREENPTIWDATAVFSSDVDEQQNNQDPESDPEEWVPIYETKFERMTEVATTDINGDPIANSAGQLFPAGQTKARFLPVWELAQFEPLSVSDETIISRNETINSATFRGRAAKTLLLTILYSAVGFHYGQRRRLTRYQIKYNRKKWTDKRLDTGTVFLDTGELKPYLDDDGNVIEGALDGSGAKVTAGDPPAVLEFDQFEELDFNDFLRF